MSIKPVIALVGRPNVGKSTIFNQITKTRQALVADMSGLTRDRQYGDARYNDKSFIVVDTGGIGESDDGFGNIDDYMSDQSHMAIHEADIIVFVVDARAGMIGSDQTIANELRMLGKPIYLAANKIDGAHDSAPVEFFALGLGEPYPMTASHGRGISNLLDDLTEGMEEQVEEVAPKGLKLAIIGRPNVGKSTLVNRLLGEDRVIVFDAPGTTRDSIYIPYEREGKDYVIIDTAGVRRRGRIGEKVEKFSVIKTLQAIKDANVVTVVIDAQEGIVDQDLHMLGFAINAGRSIVVAINKWDGLDHYQKTLIKSEIERRFSFVPYVKVHFISALHGTNVGNLYPSIHKAYDSAMLQVSTSKLTNILQDAITAHTPPIVSGRRVKLRYAHLGGHNPPIVVIHGNQTDAIPKSYKRYLEGQFREVFKLEGTPLRVEFKQNTNPFEGVREKTSKLKAQEQRKNKKLTKFNHKDRK